MLPDQSYRMSFRQPIHHSETQVVRREFVFRSGIAEPDNEFGLSCEYHEVVVRPDDNDYHSASKYYAPVCHKLVR